MIKKVKSRLIETVKTKRINIFLLFFTLSFAILLLTKLSKDYTKTLTFKLVPNNIHDELVIINDTSNVVQVSVETNGFNFIRYYLSKPKLSIEIEKDLMKDDSIYYWTKNKYYSQINNQFNKDIRLKNVSPDTLVFMFDVNKVKYVPVVLNPNVNFSPGYDLIGNFNLSPDSIKVIGPNNLLQEIDSLVTEPLSLEEVKSNIKQSLGLVLPQDNNIRFSNKEIIVEGNVERFTEGTVQIPITLKNVPEDVSLKYFPKVVSVSYYVSLNEFKTISESSFAVECDYNNLQEDQTFLTPQITKKPSQAKNVKINQQRIEFIITE